MSSQPARATDLDAATIRTPGGRYRLEEDYGDAAREAFAACSKHLRTSFLNPFVSAGDARAVMDELGKLSFAEVVAVVHVLGESTDGSTNLLAKLYSRGLDSDELRAEWKKLVATKIGSATRGGQLPDLADRFQEYQRKYVPEDVLGRGF